jgi:hypothetical protein
MSVPTLRVRLGVPADIGWALALAAEMARFGLPPWRDHDVFVEQCRTSERVKSDWPHLCSAELAPAWRGENRVLCGPVEPRSEIGWGEGVGRFSLGEWFGGGCD